MPLPRALCLALVVLGLALVFYGTASLTGGWMGTPPWWESRESAEPLPPPELVRIEGGEPRLLQRYPAAWFVPEVTPREGRELISGAVIAVGVGLATWGAWPPRRRATT